jgi:hypothetical protein
LDLLQEWQSESSMLASPSSSSSNRGSGKEGGCRIDCSWLTDALQQQCKALLAALQRLVQAPGEQQQQQQQQPEIQQEQQPHLQPQEQLRQQQAAVGGCKQQQQAAGKPGKGVYGKLTVVTDSEDEASDSYASSSSDCSSSSSAIASIIPDSEDGAANAYASRSNSSSGNSSSSQVANGYDDSASNAGDDQQNRYLVDDFVRKFWKVAKCLVVAFIAQAWQSCGGAASPVWQQAVPLQVILLCSQLQQLEAAVHRWAQFADQLVQQQQQDHQLQQQQQPQPQNLKQQQEQQCQQQQKQQELQQVLLQHVVALLQSIRQFSTAVEASSNTTAAAVATASVPTTVVMGNNSSNNSNGEVQPLHPAAFFSAGGPLAGGLWGFQQPTGAGIWAPSHAAEPQQSQDQHSSNNCKEHKHAQVQQEAWEVLLGSCAWQAAQAVIHDDVAVTYAEASQEVFSSIYKKVDKLVFSNAMRKATPEQKRLAEAYLEKLEELEVDDEHMFLHVEQLVLLHAAAAQELAELRDDVLRDLGFDTTEWLKQDERAQVDAKQRSEAAKLRAQSRKLQAYTPSGTPRDEHIRRQKLNIVCELKREDWVDQLHLDSDDELELYEMAKLDAAQPAACRAGATSTTGFSSAFAAADTGASGSSGGDSEEAAALWDVAPAVYAGTSALRCVHCTCRILMAALSLVLCIGTPCCLGRMGACCAASMTIVWALHRYCMTRHGVHVSTTTPCAWRCTPQQRRSATIMSLPSFLSLYTTMAPAPRYEYCNNINNMRASSAFSLTKCCSAHLRCTSACCTS